MASGDFHRGRAGRPRLGILWALGLVLACATGVATDADLCRVSLRFFIERDVAEVVAIAQRSLESPWDADMFRAVRREDGVVGTVAEDAQGRVVGYVVYREEPAGIAILDFAVHPDARNRGVGERLLASLVERLSPLHRVQITIRIPETNVAAIRWFHHAGFDLTEVVRGAAPGEPTRAHMRLPLDRALARRAAYGPPGPTVRDVAPGGWPGPTATRVLRFASQVPSGGTFPSAGGRAALRQALIDPGDLVVATFGSDGLLLGYAIVRGTGTGWELRTVVTDPTLPRHRIVLRLAAVVAQRMEAAWIDTLVVPEADVAMQRALALHGLRAMSPAPLGTGGARVADGVVMELPRVDVPAAAPHLPPDLPAAGLARYQGITAGSPLLGRLAALDRGTSGAWTTERFREALATDDHAVIALTTTTGIPFGFAVLHDNAEGTLEIRRFAVSSRFDRRDEAVERAMEALDPLLKGKDMILVPEGEADLLRHFERNGWARNVLDPHVRGGILLHRTPPREPPPEPPLARIVPRAISVSDAGRENDGPLTDPWLKLLAFADTEANPVGHLGIEPHGTRLEVVSDEVRWDHDPRAILEPLARRLREVMAAQGRDTLIVPATRPDVVRACEAAGLTRVDAPDVRLTASGRRGVMFRLPGTIAP